MSLFSKISDSYRKEISGYGLAVFRIAYSAILLCEILQLYFFRHLIFEHVPFDEPTQLGTHGVLLVTWMFVLALLILGAFTRPAALINYLFSLFYFSQITTFEYHVFYVYVSVNFFINFLDIGTCFSIDRTLLRIKYSTPKQLYTPNSLVPQLHYFVIPAFVLGFFYLDSVFYKLDSVFWTAGLGLWLPASIPFATHLDLSLMLNQRELMIFLGYLTLIFETIFLFVFWIKTVRVPLLLIGLGLHLGIVIVFPIPWFGLAMATLYIVMVPVGWWGNLRKRISSRKSRLSVFYDSECPLCMYTRIILESVDFRRTVTWKTVQSDAGSTQGIQSKPINELLENIHSVDHQGNIYVGLDTYRQIFRNIIVLSPLALLLRLPIISQLGCSLYRIIADRRQTARCTYETCSILVNNPDNTANTHGEQHFPSVNPSVRARCWCLLFTVLLALQVNSSLKAFDLGSRYVRGFSGFFLGITPHGLFTEKHFENYQWVFALEWIDSNQRRTWLPIIDKYGMPGYYNYGMCWRNWTFNTNSRNGDFAAFSMEVSRWFLFWSRKNHIDLSKGKFLIYRKPIIVPSNWEPDLLSKQLSRKFELAGTATWDGERFIFLSQ